MQSCGPPGIEFETSGSKCLHNKAQRGPGGDSGGDFFFCL